MAKLNWDRELREARKRKHGTVPLWADPSAISHQDDREIRRLLAPLVEVVEEFATMSLTQRRQRESEFAFRLRRQTETALNESFENATAREVLSARAQLLADRLKEFASAGAR